VSLGGKCFWLRSVAGLAELVELKFRRSVIRTPEECYTYSRGVLYVLRRSVIRTPEECYTYSGGVLYVLRRSVIRTHLDGILGAHFF